MRVIVAQLGARHRYAVPRMLEMAGYLEALYTDACGDAGAGAVLSKGVPSLLRRGPIRRLAERRVLAVPPEKIRTSTAVLLRAVALETLGRARGAAYTRGTNVMFARAMIGWGVGSADTVYSLHGEGLAFLEYARARGLRIVVEVYANPIGHRIVREERARFPEWEAQEPLEGDRAQEERWRRLSAVADLVICPSAAVAEGLSFYMGGQSKAIRIVPYACGIDFAGRRNTPVRGRILFPGRGTLAKGVHYLAAAAQSLANAGIDLDFRIAGTVSDRIRCRPECRVLNFLGHVPRTAMVEEFMQADVVVLPTLTEGSATAIYEALAAGVPVVTTPSAGSVVTNGVEGILVPERDAASLAHAIRRVVLDRDLRHTMSEAALAAAHDHSEEAWAVRLLNAMQSVGTRPADSVPNHLPRLDVDRGPHDARLTR